MRLDRISPVKENDRYWWSEKKKLHYEKLSRRLPACQLIPKWLLSNNGLRTIEWELEIVRDVMSSTESVCVFLDP
jgi:hypothetical protein